MRGYASDTGVSSDRSQAEIRRLLMQWGADKFGIIDEKTRVTLAFQIRNRAVRFYVPLPDPNGKEFTHTPAGRARRSKEDAYTVWEQACRQRWRILLLTLRAKLEAIDKGISTFDDEFLAHVVMPNGQTFGEWATPQLDEVCGMKKMPPLLPSGG